jgi:hypothetical protein
MILPPGVAFHPAPPADGACRLCVYSIWSTRKRQVTACGAPYDSRGGTGYFTYTMPMCARDQLHAALSKAGLVCR